MTAQAHRVCAWITNDYYGPDDIARDGPKAAERLGYTSNNMAPSGWTPVGYAEITLHLDNADTLISNKVQSLRSQAEKIKADSTHQLTAIERKINELLALPMTKTGAAP